jgi:hypothetical protein
MSLRSEIREALIANPKGILIEDLFEACASAEDEKKFRGNFSVLKAEGKVKILGTTDEEKPRALYGLGEWPEQELRGRAEKKPGKRKQARAPAVQIVNNAAPSTNGASDGAQFAINEAGELGIEKGDQRIRLDREEFARLRAFEERTEEVWKGLSK